MDGVDLKTLFSIACSEMFTLWLFGGFSRQGGTRNVGTRDS